MRNWFAGLSWPGIFIYFALTYGFISWLVGLIGGQPAASAAIIPSLLAGILFSAITTPFVMLRRRRSNPTGRPVVSVGVALRRGTLPGLINPDTWLPALANRAASDRSVRRVGIVLIVIGGLFSLFSFGNRNWLGWVLCATLLIVVSVWRVTTAHLELPRIAMLEADIRETYMVVPEDKHEAS